MSELENTYNLEINTEEELENIGYPLSYVKIGESIINVIVYEPEPSVSKASKIISKVMKITDLDYKVAVEFKD